MKLTKVQLPTKHIIGHIRDNNNSKHVAANLKQQQKLLITVSEDVEVYEQVKLLVKPREVIKPDGKLADMLRHAVSFSVRLESTGYVRCRDFLFLAVRRRREGKRLINVNEKQKRTVVDD